MLPTAVSAYAPALSGRDVLVRVVRKEQFVSRNTDLSVPYLHVVPTRLLHVPHFALSKSKCPTLPAPRSRWSWRPCAHVSTAHSSASRMPVQLAQPPGFSRTIADAISRRRKILAVDDPHLAARAALWSGFIVLALTGTRCESRPCLRLPASALRERRGISVAKMNSSFGGHWRTWTPAREVFRQHLLRRVVEPVGQQEG